MSGQTEPPSSPSHCTHSVLIQPSARDGHSACAIQEQPRPLMLVTGGWGTMDNALNDMWLLDINSGLWSQVLLCHLAQPRQFSFLTHLSSYFINVRMYMCISFIIKGTHYTAIVVVIHYNNKNTDGIYRDYCTM